MPSPISLESGSTTGVKAGAAHSRQQLVTKAAVKAPASAPALQRAATKLVEAHTTTATVRYCKEPKGGDPLRNYLYELPEGVDKACNLEHQECDVTVTDLRSAPQSFNLRDNGFQLEKLEVPEDVDWQDEEQVKERVYPLIDALLKRATGATRTLIFDHTLRNGRIELKPQDQASPRGKPVPVEHVDYTTKSGYERLEALVSNEEAERLRKTPFAAVQMWRPLKGPVDESPLGVIDASTVDKGDLMQNTLHFPDRTGCTYAVKHNAKHTFYYVKGMEVDEAYVFVCYDSRADGRARFTPHTGLLDHGTSPDAPPRESVELRSYCFWEDLPPQEAAMQL